ncbi:MAG: trigger factor [Candidatus Saccharimonadales bacterium]
MHVKKDYPTPTNVQLVITAEQAELDAVKAAVLTKLSKSSVAPQGFRKGKAPLSLIEKQLNPELLQSEFLEEAINRLYADSIDRENIRPVSSPEVSIVKFVPFTTLEFKADVEAVGDITLPDYTKIKLGKKPVTVTAEDISKVIDDLKLRAADHEDVERAAKDGDQVVIDFEGTDTKTGEPIEGADGQAYPLVIGSDTFIPGFEPHLVGLKTGDEKTFDITFPKEYNVAALQSRKVTFKVTAQKVQKVVEPKLDDAFAAKVGPFKTMTELKDDIKRQLATEKEQQNDADYQNELLQKIAEKSKVEVPKTLVDEEIERQERQERQNLIYRGQTWEEHLKEEGQTDEGHREKNRPMAALNVKAGLVLSEIALQEKISVTPDEFKLRVQLMKGQYPDQQMQAELDKPENRRDIMSRMLTEKTIAKLTEYATAK